ncbi:hypothetical protein TNCV_2089391 [Trichonephila clavipes]|nr:hypothetical protein TNCV_2089391 [Trichonephila clavipes]
MSQAPVGSPSEEGWNRRHKSVALGGWGRERPANRFSFPLPPESMEWKRKLDLTGASEMNRLYPNSRRESGNENQYLNTLPRRGGGWRKKRWNEKENGNCKTELAAGTIVELKQEPALITDPNSDVGKSMEWPQKRSVLEIVV